MFFLINANLSSLASLLNSSLFIFNLTFLYFYIRYLSIKYIFYYNYNRFEIYFKLNYTIKVIIK